MILRMALKLNGEAGDVNQWQHSSLSNDLSFLLARVNADSIACGNSALKELGLKARSYAVLSLVCDDLKPTQRDLAEFLRLDPSQVVTLIDELEGKQLVVRQPDPRDRRSKIVIPTSKGNRLRTEAEAAIANASDKLSESLTAEQRKHLAVLLRTLAFS